MTKLSSFFKDSQEISFQVLWDIPSGKSSSLVSTYQQTDLETMTINHDYDKDSSDTRDMVATARKNDPSVTPDSRVFIELAWTNIHEFRLFKMFPEVIHIDATCDTTSSSNHLLTFTSRCATGQKFTFLRIWIPNQRMSSFSWVFKIVLPTFIPPSYYGLIKFIMADGDCQRSTAIFSAIK